MAVAVHVLDITTDNSQYQGRGTYNHVLPAHDGEATGSSKARDDIPASN